MDDFNTKTLERYFDEYRGEALVNKLSATPSSTERYDIVYSNSSYHTATKEERASINKNRQREKEYVEELVGLMKETFSDLKKAYNNGNIFPQPIHETQYKNKVEKKLRLLCCFLLLGMGKVLHDNKQPPKSPFYYIKGAYESCKCVFRDTWKKDYKGTGLYTKDELKDHITYEKLIRNSWYISAIMAAIFDAKTEFISYVNPYDIGRLYNSYECKKVIKNGIILAFDKLTSKNGTTYESERVSIEATKETLKAEIKKSINFSSTTESKEKIWYSNWNVLFNGLGISGPITPYGYTMPTSAAPVSTSTNENVTTHEPLVEATTPPISNQKTTLPSAVVQPTTGPSKAELDMNQEWGYNVPEFGARGWKRHVPGKGGRIHRTHKTCRSCRTRKTRRMHRMHRTHKTRRMRK
jgi:hypothetical protein